MDELSFFKGLNFRILILSVWMLFLELFLIRWIATEIRIFAYVNNLVLLACFIGIGLGCYFPSRKSNPLYSFTALAVLILAVKAIPFINITELLSGFSDSVIWFQALKPNNFIPAAKGVILVMFMFGMIAAVFFPIGQALASMFNDHKNTIIAYSLNVFGNIIGIWLFSALCFVYAPPWVWLSISVGLGLLFVQKRLRDLLCLVCLWLFSFIVILPSSSNCYTMWTPYHKLDIYENYVRGVKNGYSVMVNTVGYMALFDISGEFIDKNFKELKLVRNFNQYELPYLLKKNVKDVLIVGAGGGNDVAGALRQNAGSIDAVEIDPGIYEAGVLFHPEMPYADKKVHIFIDDARSFFKKTPRRYDLVSFGLLDSHTTSSNYNNIRLDHYVYTLESFEEAKRLLKRSGVVAIVFDAKRDWIAIRLRQLVNRVFGMEPLTLIVNPPHPMLGWGGIMYVAGPGLPEILNNLETNKELKKYIEEHRISIKDTDVKITTDDWPYLYLKGPSIPKMQLCIMAGLLIVFCAGARTLFAKSGKFNMHFFFLGAAFMLLEFQNISKSSLLFGSTWLVNSYMFTAILLLILLANLFAYYFKTKNIKPFYYILWVFLAVMYVVPISSLNLSNYYLKASLISVFLNMPVFFAGVIFINSFKNCRRKDMALGSNLLGASLGGLMESLSFVTGIRALVLLVLFFYVLSYLFLRENQ